MKHPFVLLALLACFAIAVLAYRPAQASSPTVAVVSSQPEAPSQTCWGCGPVPQPGGVFDRGPRPHATGYVNGSYYCVAFGDTLFSISQRFGVSAQQIAAANGIPNPWLIWANQFILIPGLGIAPPITPTPTPTSIPQQASITVSNPTANSSLPATFQVSGVATGPNGATIAVQAQNNSSGVLAGTTTTLQTTSGTFGSGSWSVSLTVNQVVAGRIVAALVGQPIGPANVPVTFNGGSSQQLVITQPTLNAQLPANFIVSGSGFNLPGNQVTVQAVTNGGAVLQTQQAFLQNIQPNGQGTWQANFSNVSAGAPTLGRIVASAAPGSTVPPQSVNVTFNGVALQQLTITQPMQGQTVSPTFDVIGTGTNLPGNQVTVQVLNGTGSVQQTVLATVQNIQPNGQGTWQVRFINVNTGDPYFGQVRAVAAAGSTAPPAIVPVIINGPGQ